MANQTLYIDLSISEDEILRMYSGDARYFQAIARDGRTIRFPASVLRQFVRHDGLHGCFKFVTDEQHKLKSIEQVY